MAHRRDLPRRPRPSGRSSHDRPVPDVGGDTEWASLQDAYDGLADPVRAMCDELIAIHFDPWFAADVEAGAATSGTASTTTSCSPPSTRWCAPTPRTAGRGLFVNPQFTQTILGLSNNESDAVLEMLYRHCQKPEYTCRFRWRPGSVAFWDNRATLHYALDDYGDALRVAHRVTLRGDCPLRPGHAPRPGSGRASGRRRHRPRTRRAPPHWPRGTRPRAARVAAATSSGVPTTPPDPVPSSPPGCTGRRPGARRARPGRWWCRPSRAAGRSRGTNASASRWAMPAVGSSSRSRRGRASTIEARSTTRRVPVDSCDHPVPAESVDPERTDDLVHLPPAWSVRTGGPTASAGWPRPRPPGAGRRGREQHVLHGQLGEEPAVLERPDDAHGGPLLGQVPVQRLAVQRAPSPARERHQTRDHVEQRRLARPVGSDQPDDGARLGHQVDPVEGPDPAEVARPRRYLEPGRARAGPRRSPLIGPRSPTPPVRPGCRIARRTGRPGRLPSRAIPRSTRSPRRWSSSASPPGGRG